MKCPCCNGRGRVPNDAQPAEPPRPDVTVARKIAMDLRCSVNSYARRQGIRLEAALDQLEGASGG